MRPMKTATSVLVVAGGIFLIAAAKVTLGQSQDCNNNDIEDACDIDCGGSGGSCDVPGCGRSPDCNANGVPDECDLVGGSVEIFATGMAIPEDIVPSQGSYPPGFFVPDADANAVFKVSSDGSSVVTFTTGLSDPIGAVFAPDEFGGIGERLFVTNRNVSGGGFGPGVVVVDAVGNASQFVEIGGVSGITGLAYLPQSIGGPNAGKLLLTAGASTQESGRGLAYTIDVFGNASLIAPHIGSAPFTPALAPPEFGDFGNHLFMGSGVNRLLYSLDLQTNEVIVFTEVPSEFEDSRLRQIAFSPLGWFESLDPSLADRSVMVVSVTVSSQGGGMNGALVALDQEGLVVGMLTQATVGASFDPRGMLFVGSDLLVSNSAQGSLIQVSVDDFSLIDCNGNGIPDGCDIADGSSEDCTGNAIPDECEPDCNNNGSADICDLADQTSEDCNLNEIPDECDLASGSSLDDDDDGLPDECDLLVVEDKTDPGAQELGLVVCNVYAEFDGPSPQYKVLSVGFSDVITDDPAGFFQHEFGGGTAPLEALIELFPTLEYDSFVTIGVKVNDGSDTTSLDPEFDFDFLGDPARLFGGWFNSNPTNDQGHPDEDFRVLIAQFSVNQGFTVSGTLSVFASVDGEPFQYPTSFQCFVEPCESDAECDDDNACTDDSCIDNICVHAPNDDNCNDGDACTADSCDPASGCINEDISAECDDSNACTADSCDPATGCISEDSEQTLIIKQGACPAPVNPNSNGVIPVLLVGSNGFDVNNVNLDSLDLHRCDGVGGSAAPLVDHTHVSDLNHPNGSVGCGECACNDDQSSDGIDDLAMKFRTSDTLEALILGVGDGVVTLELTGEMMDGTPFCARDCVIIVPPGTGSSSMSMEASVFDTFVEVEPLDLNIDSDGFSNFTRAYLEGTVVTINAPILSNGRRFLRWSVDGVLQPFGLRTIEVTATAEDIALMAIYERPNRLEDDRPEEDDGDLE